MDVHQQREARLKRNDATFDARVCRSICWFVRFVDIKIFHDYEISTYASLVIYRTNQWNAQSSL